MISLKKTLIALIPSYLRPRAITHRRLERVARGAVVLSGPFSGMKYVSQSVGSMWWPKILGTYELELAGIIRGLCLARPGLVIDIGAAEGYYAVGMAWRCPEAQIISFEGELLGRQLQAELAALNGVSARVRIESHCDHRALRTALARADNGIIICDIEGGERTLLDPGSIPELTAGRWTLLVEIHDHISADIASTLIDRFRSTHTIEEIVTRCRLSRDLPPAVRCSFLARWTRPYMDERRPGPMRWLLLRPAA